MFEANYTNSSNFIPLPHYFLMSRSASARLICILLPRIRYNLSCLSPFKIVRVEQRVDENCNVDKRR